MDFIKLIQSVRVWESNLNFIAKHGTINGTLLMDIERLMKLAYNQALEDAADKAVYVHDSWGGGDMATYTEDILSLKKQ